MKSTSTGALSFVMHVWWGIMRNRSRRSTRTGLSIPGMMMTIPGPFSAWAFPRRKFTIRSYSFTTLIVAKTKIRTMITRKKNTTKKPITSAPWSANTGPATSGMLPIPPIPLPRPWMVGPFLKAMGGFPRAAASPARPPHESIESFIPKLQVPRRDAAGGPTGDVGAGTEEVVTREELRVLLDRAAPKAYVGLEPSGLMHVGTAFVIGSKITDLVDAGFNTIIFLADWHAYSNDKLDGNLENRRVSAEYFKDAFRPVGVPDSL